MLASSMPAVSLVGAGMTFMANNASPDSCIPMATGMGPRHSKPLGSLCALLGADCTPPASSRSSMMTILGGFKTSRWCSSVAYQTAAAPSPSRISCVRVSRGQWKINRQGQNLRGTRSGMLLASFAW
jgi:hypothetical protein